MTERVSSSLHRLLLWITREVSIGQLHDSIPTIQRSKQGNAQRGENAMKVRLLGAAAIASALVSGEALGHNVRMTSNLSPYLHLTRIEFQLNDSFPVYQKLVRPQLDQHQSRTQFPNAGVKPRPGPLPRPTFSPYLHLTRKTVNPFLPMYQSVVRPTSDRQNRRLQYRDVSRYSHHGHKAFVSHPLARPRTTTDFRAFPTLNGAPTSQPSMRFDSSMLQKIPTRSTRPLPMR